MAFNNNNMFDDTNSTEKTNVISDAANTDNQSSESSVEVSQSTENKSSNDRKNQNSSAKSNNANKPYNNNKKKWHSNKRFAKSEFEEQVIKVKRVSKTTKGGRQSRIWILVVVGNKKGRVGYGVGKSKEFPIAIKKATKNATKNAIKVPINHKGTVYHEYLGKYNASRVLIKPAKPGTGIIAGGPIKKILELAGYQNIYSKNLGSNSPINMLHATMDALLKQRSPAFIAKLRDKTFKELFHL